MTFAMHPLASSAQATTAAESRFRIDYPLVPARSPRVVGLDAAAGRMVARVAALPWETASFYTIGEDDLRSAVTLHGIGGGEVPLEDAIIDIDAMILVATADTGTDAARRIAEACAARAIMVAGIVIGEGEVRETVAHLRPFARILLVSYEEHDIDAILLAIRA